MPNVTTYIRNADMELWLACPNKAELIHNALHGSMDGDINRISKLMDKPSPEYITPIIKTPINIPGVRPASEIFTPKAPDPVLGYPCCQNKTPCKHWLWDGVESAYKNSITGELKEVL